MAKKTFKAETKQLLNLVVNSLYTHPEVFLRELISNASDALDKVHFLSLTQPDILKDDTELKIRIEVDKDKRELAVIDNGIGMSYQEVIDNLGTIANSGTKNFLQKLEEAKKKGENLELIGQFGVGFYSVFMVADKVTVYTKRIDEEKGVKWESTGEENYLIEEIDLENRGTKVVLHLKDLSEEMPDFLEQFVIEGLIKKYSDYIKYPIQMEVEEEVEEGEGEEKKTVKKKVWKTLNSMTPLWQKNPKDVKFEEYASFYKSVFHDWEDPLDVIYFKAEGTIEFTVLLFIPGRAPFNFYLNDYKKGLQLYSKRVFIMDNCEELVPDYFKFLRGLVDSSDFTLNVSRETLQYNRQLKVIAKNIENKVLKKLSEMLKEDREKYEKFWKEFGLSIKAGLYGNISKKDDLQDLLLFSASNTEKEFITLQEYVDSMQEGQEKIFYIYGKDKESIENLPQMEYAKSKGYQVIYLLEPFEELLLEQMLDYKDKKFQSLSRADFKENEAEQKKLEEEKQGLLKEMKEILQGKVEDVKLSFRLTNSPACIVSGEGVSLSMERLMQQLNKEFSWKAKKILELNPAHPLFVSLENVYQKGEKELLKKYANLVYNEALLLENLELQNPKEFISLVNELLGGKTEKSSDVNADKERETEEEN
jgi:molecular chaperone HtpG